MSKPPASVAEIRQSFLDFFASKGHTVVPSSPLVPNNDPTLMFTNSGMVQFKDVFLGTDKRPYVRAASVQACLRAGGKHNDLENVGYTARHHTFFEMMGNWSFGDYFKKESIEWGWELLTQVYGLPPERLTATVYKDDDEAYDIWLNVIGLPAERIIRIGDNKGGAYKSDNFWMMADTGPCGPCSEIFYDHGPHIAGGPPGSPDEDGDRYIEIWNHVFMQFEMHADGSLTKLPAPCVDTGMGLERLAAILQHVHSNYEIDLFAALIKAAARETGCTDLNHPSLKVIADHIRATAFLASDGVLPGAEGRSYVQRRIIRRAIRHGYKLGQKKPFFHKLVADLVALMGDAYPRLREQQAQITEALQMEEERFVETLEHGIALLEAAFADMQQAQPNAQPSTQQLSGELAFKLHDTYGFPLDLTQDVCRERGIAVDEAGFDAAMQQQKDTARAAGKFKMDKLLDYEGAANTFTGYEHLQEATAQVVALYANGEPVQQLQAGQDGVVVLDTTPFYAESGGQVGDQGWICVDCQAPVPAAQASTCGCGCSQAAPLALAANGLPHASVAFAVTDTQKIKADVYGHHGTLKQGTLRVGDRTSAHVTPTTRSATTRNHSVTHLMHKALRDVLGSHVQQKGSLVTPERTRFDFTHNAPVTAAQIRQVEEQVNAEILQNSRTQAQLMDMEAARATGAMMLFGEKYGDVVRVLNIGSSVELCGGTHVRRTGDIGLFKIVAEGGVSSGIRRVEAITGNGALGYLQQLEGTVEQTASALRSTPAEMPERIGQLHSQMKELEKEIAALKGKLASSQGDELLQQAADVQGIKVMAARLDGADAKTLRETLDKLKDKLKTAAIVLATVDGDKVQLAAGVSKDSIGKIKAGELVNFVAQQVGGKGGGKPDMAMAGGTNPAGLDAALASVQGWVAQQL